MNGPVSLNVSGSVQLDSNGNGQVKLGPQSAREIWYPTNAHVNVATNSSEATCTIYVGDAPRIGTFRDTTFTGSTGDMCDGLTDTVGQGWYIYAVWSGGDPGANANLTVTGSRSVNAGSDAIH